MVNPFDQRHKLAFDLYGWKPSNRRSACLTSAIRGICPVLDADEESFFQDVRRANDEYRSVLEKQFNLEEDSDHWSKLEHYKLHIGNHEKYLSRIKTSCESKICTFSENKLFNPSLIDHTEVFYTGKKGHYVWICEPYMSVEHLVEDWRPCLNQSENTKTLEQLKDEAFDLGMDLAVSTKGLWNNGTIQIAIGRPEDLRFIWDIYRYYPLPREDSPYWESRWADHLIELRENHYSGIGRRFDNLNITLTDVLYESFYSTVPGVKFAFDKRSFVQAKKAYKSIQGKFFYSNIFEKYVVANKVDEGCFCCKDYAVFPDDPDGDICHGYGAFPSDDCRCPQEIIDCNHRKSCPFSDVLYTISIYDEHPSPKKLKKESDDLTMLYKHFDENNALLYVGITKSFEARTYTHAKEAPWRDEIHHSTAIRYNSREEALESEKRTIKNEKPLYNKIHNG